MVVRGEAENHSLKCSQVIHGTKAWSPSKVTKHTAPCSLASQRRVDCYPRFGFFKLIGKSVKKILIAAWTF